MSHGCYSKWAMRENGKREEERNLFQIVKTGENVKNNGKKEKLVRCAFQLIEQSTHNRTQLVDRDH